MLPGLGRLKLRRSSQYCDGVERSILSRVPVLRSESSWSDWVWKTRGEGAHVLDEGCDELFDD
jgi:hypothetical protein